MTRIKEYPVTAALLLSELSFLLLLRTFDDPILIAKGFFFASSLILIEIRDGLTHEIPDLYLLPVLASGLLDFHLVSSIEGFFTVSLALLLTSRLTHGGISGGDVKFMAAAGFVLGPVGVTGGALMGLLAFWVIHLFRRNHCEKKIAYAMAPWLGPGCFLAYLLTGGMTA